MTNGIAILFYSPVRSGGKRHVGAGKHRQTFPSAPPEGLTCRRQKGGDAFEPDTGSTVVVKGAAHPFKTQHSDEG